MLWTFIDVPNVVVLPSPQISDFEIDLVLIGLSNAQLLSDTVFPMIEDSEIESNPYAAPHATVDSESLDAKTIRKIRPAATGLILMLSLQASGYVLAGMLALCAFLLGSHVGGSRFGACFAVGHFCAMIFMVLSLHRVKRLKGLRNGRIAAALACIPFVSPAIWIGIPLGVWLSIVLWRQDVAAAFQAAREGRLAEDPVEEPSILS